MSKFLIIALLVGILLFFIFRRLMSIPLFSGKRLERPGFISIEAESLTIDRTIKTTLTSIGIGFILLLIVLLLGTKIKILFFLLPISFYLMGHIFLLANHVNSTKNQKIWFNPQTNDILIEHKKQGNIILNLYRDVKEVVEVKSIQKNRGVLFGYTKLVTNTIDIHIPFLYRENKKNNFFFLPLQHDFDVKSTSVFFPFLPKKV